MGSFAESYAFSLHNAFIAYFCIMAAFWFSVSPYIPSHYVHPVCHLYLYDYMSKSVALISWPLKKKTSKLYFADHVGLCCHCPFANTHI